MLSKIIKKYIAGFLCVAILMTMNVAVPTKTEAALKLSQSKAYVLKGHKVTLKLGTVDSSKVSLI